MASVRTESRGDTMASTTADYVVDRVEAEGFEPDIIDGAQVGECHQIEPTGDSAGKLDASLWRSDPATYDYFFQGDEAFHVLEGTATVELPDSGEKIELRVGDVAYFSAGTRSIWKITTPFKKFTVIAN
jgi:uncharacterized cupin superfamily protein